MTASRRPGGIFPVSNDFLHIISSGDDRVVLQDFSRLAGTLSPPAADLGDNSLHAASISSCVNIKSVRLVTHEV